MIRTFTSPASFRRRKDHCSVGSRQTPDIFVFAREFKLISLLARFVNRASHETPAVYVSHLMQQACAIAQK
jgi:hypothetical protein